MPIFVFIAVMLADYGFVLGRLVVVFYAVRLGASTAEILLMGASAGVVYTITAGWFAGGAIRRFGSPRLIHFAGAGLGLSFLLLPLVPRVWWLWFCMTWSAIPLALFWPSAQSRLIERVAPAAVPRVQSMFNFAWSGAILLSLATGGWLFEFGVERLGWGPWLAVIASVLPSLIIAVLPLPSGTVGQDRVGDEPPAHRGEAIQLSPGALRLFGIAGWLGNFMSFLMFDTIRLVFPSLGAELGFSETVIGIVMGIPLITQPVMFGIAMLWQGWIYKKRWLYVPLTLHGVALVIFCVASRPPVFAIAFMCGAIGLSLTYTASLFYSLGASQSAGHAGGSHEAIIGSSRVIGPVFGAAAAHALHSSRAPFFAYLGILAVVVVLTAVTFARIPAADRDALRAARA